MRPTIVLVDCFENGADDYVVKPFELDVLLVRIKALLRRTGDAIIVPVYRTDRQEDNLNKL